MYNEINQQLEEVSQKVYRYKKIDKMLGELQSQKKLLEKKVSEGKKIIDKEDLDLERLEEKNLTHLFYSVLGNIQEKMQKEQQEALAAHLKYDQAVLDLANINSEIERLRSEFYTLKNVESLYQELYQKKMDLLLKSNSITAVKIMGLTEQLSTEKNLMKEIREAINAGSKVTRHLDSTSESLNSAAGWGTWDILGGGLLTDMIKHGHIDDAKSEAEQTQMALQNFRTELADIKIDSSISINIEGFGKFADFFFDGLIADWCMQSRIHDSQASVDNVKGQVDTVVGKLTNMLNGLMTHSEHLEEEIRAQVEGA